MKPLGVLGLLLAFPVILIGILLWNIWGMGLVGVGVWMIAESSASESRSKRRSDEDG